MSDEDDLRLNTLHRFSKHSPRLVLEVFGSCEVPAGCGGVVLRWRNPDAGMPVLLYGAVRRGSGEPAIEVTLDGQPVETSRATVAYGAHVLALRITGLVGRGGVLLFAASPDDGRARYPEIGVSPFASRADGTWRATTGPTDDRTWLSPDYDDAGWTPLEAGTVDDEEAEDYYSFGQHVGMGAEALILPDAEEVRVRKRLALSLGDWPVEVE